MYSLKTIICLFLIGAIYATSPQKKELSEDEKKALEVLIECGNKWNISQKELKNMDQLMKDRAGEMLCFMKCSAEKDGTLDEAGNVGMKNIDRIIAMMELKSDERNNIKDCIRNVCQYVIVMNNYRPPDFISPELNLQERFRGVLDGGTNVVIFTPFNVAPRAFVFYS
ncbi:hypothetical protein WA026_019793 [Henosepilachna vigintioctopunctata]|uniref:Uncharacterized protein n=1 Tax=Henosepilachna vigintioctopunctata TaxID=420089 RepID=A0AAW1VAD5_9CUCU